MQINLYELWIYISASFASQICCKNIFFKRCDNLLWIIEINVNINLTHCRQSNFRQTNKKKKCSMLLPTCFQSKRHQFILQLLVDVTKKCLPSNHAGWALNNSIQTYVCSVQYMLISKSTDRVLFSKSRRNHDTSLIFNVCVRRRLDKKCSVNNTSQYTSRWIQNDIQAWLLLCVVYAVYLIFNSNSDW